MILRNHGLLTAGPTVADAFLTMYNLEQACRIQCDAQASGAELVVPAPEVCERTARQYAEGGERADGPAWRALLRELDRADPSYRD